MLPIGSKLDPTAAMGSRFDLVDIGPIPELRFEGLPGLGEASAAVMLLNKIYRYLTSRDFSERPFFKNLNQTRPMIVHS